jgi:D-ornithine 4,5-aminomutase subunit alpha
MKCIERQDDFEPRHQHLRRMSDGELHAYFWSLVNKIVEPLIAEARSHTTPAIERSVLLRMGFSSMEAKAIVEGLQRQRLLGRGAGRLVFELARVKGTSVREAGEALLAGRHWEDLNR